MSTIKERADIYVGHSFEIDEFTSASIKRQAFIDGAKEQRKIDVDKAWQWITNNWRKYIYQDRDGIICFGHWEADFRKAMGE